MCGIAGIFRRDPRRAEPEPLVSRMVSRMIHRGPDNQESASIRLKNGSRLALGHSRLSILDLTPSANQPFFDRSTGNAIVFNGEIYNFKALRLPLLSEGTEFITNSDTEVLLKGYARWGKTILQKLRGMFAFAIWDNTKQEIFLARDRLGIKPLYYAVSDDDFIFASEVRAILASGLVPKSIDPTGLQSYLAYGSLHDPATIINGISSLMAGHCMTYRGDLKPSTPYWAPENFIPKPENNSQKETISVLKKEISNAVNMRLLSDVPVGTFLSGGIDSNSIIASLPPEKAREHRTFSVIFEEPRYSEGNFVTIGPRRFNTIHRDILIRGTELLDLLPKIALSQDQPSFDGPNMFLVAKAVSEAGIKVALSGLGGDEIFGGYASFNKVPSRARLTRILSLFPRNLRSLFALSARLLLTKSRSTDKFAQLLSTPSNFLETYLVYRRLFLDKEMNSLLPDIAPCPDYLPPAARESHQNSILNADPITATSILETRCYMLNTLLRDSDAMGMAHSLEIRVPLIDHRVVELMLSIPGNQKLRPGNPKFLLTSNLRSEIPEALRTREKMGFGLPMDTWMKGPLKALMDETFSNFNVPGIPPEKAQDSWKFFCKSPRFNPYWWQPWALFMLQKWADANL